MLHDLGKAREGFQSYLRACSEGRKAERTVHSKWGAALAWSLFRSAPRSVRTAVALSVLGHHSGLGDVSEVESDLELLARSNAGEIESLRKVLLGLLGDDAPRDQLAHELRAESSLRQEFAIRFVFSVLIEADRWDTACFYRRAPEGHAPSLRELLTRLDRNQDKLLAELPGQIRNSPVNLVRREVYESCCRAANGPPGFYRLTVPTGGGKTRSSLAFALRHAVAHGKRGVIYALPFTSIIDQTASVFREVLGDEAILEFHSQVTNPPPKLREEGMGQDHVRRRLEEENWDHPLVVTTTVQLFESLLASSPSRARKIQNIARSVIVLDEVQALPTEILEPTIDVLQTLVQEYGVTVLLCTATQPAFERTPFGTQLQGTEIDTMARDHFSILERVSYRWHSGPTAWKEVAGWIIQEPQGLAIVNSRVGAIRLAKEVLEVLKTVDDRESVFHLSTLLCGAHRKDVLSQVQRRLKAGLDVRLISTQVVEAGVDLDFPVVWRALAPLDRIIQAAGRCNREGRLATRGRVVLFEPAEESIPLGSYRLGTGRTRSLLDGDSRTADSLGDPTFIRQYFEGLFDDLALEKSGFDKQEIQAFRRAWAFEQVGRRYRLITDDTIPVIVDYPMGEHRGRGLAMAKEWIDTPSKETWQRLQAYAVNLRRRDFEMAEAHRQLVRVRPDDELGIWRGTYDMRFGLPLNMMDPVDPAS